MNRQTLQIVGTLVLIAGITLGSIGTHRVLTNLAVSDAKALEDARRALSTEGETPTTPGEASLRGNVELQVWTSAMKMTNQGREERRSEGAVLLLSGIIALIWGTTLLYTSRNTSSEP